MFIRNQLARAFRTCIVLLPPKESSQFVVGQFSFSSSVSSSISSTKRAMSELQQGSCANGVCVPKRKGVVDALLSARSDGITSSTSESHQVDVPDTTNKTSIQIDVISDTMCPWCWVGKRGLEKALELSPNIEAKVNWHPFFLDKNLPEEGKPVDDYYLQNYGDPKVGDSMAPQLVKAGKRCGIDFESHFVGLERYRPTIRSHRLIALAKEQDKEDTMVEALFHMYYEEGKHLNSIEHLVETAAKVDLEGDIEAFLRSSEKEQEVYEKADSVKYMAQGVPTFLFSRPDRPDAKPLSFSGGQPPQAFVRVFDHLKDS